MTKVETMKELKKLGIAFDPASKASELLALLPVEPETPIDVVVVEPSVEPVVEAVVEPKVLSAREELKRIYAASKAKNPVMYAFKNKDAQLAIKLSKL